LLSVDLESGLLAIRVADYLTDSILSSTELHSGYCFGGAFFVKKPFTALMPATVYVRIMLLGSGKYAAKKMPPTKHAIPVIMMHPYLTMPNLARRTLYPVGSGTTTRLRPPKRR